MIINSNSVEVQYGSDVHSPMNLQYETLVGASGHGGLNALAYARQQGHSYLARLLREEHSKMSIARENTASASGGRLV